MNDSRRTARLPGRMPSRSGQALVEFALIALVLYMLLAAILTFGHLLFVAQGLQTAADLAARELSRTALPHDMTFEAALEHDDVRRTIFDDAYLVIDLAEFFGVNPEDDVFRGIMRDVDENLVPQMPLVNQQLVPLMIVDRPDFDGDGEPDAWLLRYPGALLSRTEPPTAPEGKSYRDWVSRDFTVGIPFVRTDTNGAETIRWLPVVEEIESPEFASNDQNPSVRDPFVLTAEPKSGVVALRINYPFQSAAMSSFRPNSDGPFEPNIGTPNYADDSAVSVLNPDALPGELIGGPLVADDGTFAGVYGGQYGLGSQAVRGDVVRPYRRVISTQAIYRREIFE